MLKYPFINIFGGLNRKTEEVGDGINIVPKSKQFQGPIAVQLEDILKRNKKGNGASKDKDKEKDAGVKAATAAMAKTSIDSGKPS
eukprot:g51219.t1